MRDSIVRKVISFIEPQRKFIETEVRPLRAIFVGITAKPNTNAREFITLPHIPYKFI
jgi:hypothetical protein